MGGRKKGEVVRQVDMFLLIVIFMENMIQMFWYVWYCFQPQTMRFGVFPQTMHQGRSPMKDRFEAWFTSEVRSWYRFGHLWLMVLDQHKKCYPVLSSSIRSAASINFSLSINFHFYSLRFSRFLLGSRVAFHCSHLCCLRPPISAT
jgi:hypothetical protein